MGQKMRCVAALMLLISCGTALHGQTEQFWAGWLDTFGPAADPNTGLTAFPILSIPAGGRFEGMGTAGTATADDLSAMEANPAAAAGDPAVRLGLYHHEWYTDARLETICLTASGKVAGLVAGAKVLTVPFTAYDDAGYPTGSGYYLEGVAVVGGALRLLSAPRLAMSIGAGAKVALRLAPPTVLARQATVGFPADVGLLVQARLLDLSPTSTRRNLALGISLRNFGPATMPTASPLPTALSAGLAYSPLLPLLVAVDLVVPISLDPQGSPASRPVLATGVRLALARFLSVCAGARLLTDNPRFTLGAEMALGVLRVMVNASMDLLSGFDPTEMLSLGSVIDLGPER